jgi:hypothetical protein
MTEEKKGFTVSDKRRFTPEGETREDAPGQPESGTAGTGTADTAEQAGSAKKAEDRRDSGSGKGPELPRVNFSMFVLSLSSSVMMALGEIEDPISGKAEKNLSMARHTIDILAMLEEKTRGNLAKDEGELLTSILYDLRMAYVRAAKG